MNVYLTGNGVWKYVADRCDMLTPEKAGNLCVLKSYYYIPADPQLVPLIPHFKSFMLDSGAFSFMQGNGGTVDFDSYLKKYISFINKHNIDLFFELDVDSVCGYERVKEYRKVLENGTGKRCIPVWHRSRGKEDFIRTCEEYPYVALGGLVGMGYSKQYWKYFTWFIQTAHKHNAKIHALGFTSLKGMEQYHFDSVDSSSWTTGNRFGSVYKFDGKTLKNIDRPPNARVKTKETAVNNFIEWVKFADYAATHL